MGLSDEFKMTHVLRLRAIVSRPASTPCPGDIHKLWTLLAWHLAIYMQTHFAHFGDPDSNTLNASSWTEPYSLWHIEKWHPHTFAL